MDNNKYFKELSRILHKQDIECGPVEDGRLVRELFICLLSPTLKATADPRVRRQPVKKAHGLF